jgi:dienelactone hydrolase
MHWPRPASCHSHRSSNADGAVLVSMTSRALTLRLWTTSICLLIASVLLAGSVHDDQRLVTLPVRGRPQSIRLYGPSDGPPVIVSSGDGGWIHLGPHVADVLASHGYFVLGLDVRAYLTAFTTDAATLRREDEPGDYRCLLDFALHGRRGSVILVGVSEGAGLSVLAATDSQNKPLIRGVVALGLGESNELGWRWKDALIYVTKGVPREPLFSASEIVSRMSPVPLAAIHSTHDEFVPLPEVQAIMQRAADPKRLTVVEASNHRFSSNLSVFDSRLLEALQWIESQRPYVR